MLLEFLTTKSNRVVIDAEQICGMRADCSKTVIYLKSGQRPHVRGDIGGLLKKWEEARELIRTEQNKNEVDRFLDRCDRLMVELPQGQPLNPLGDYGPGRRAMEAGTGLMKQVECLQAIVHTLMDAVKAAYRKHHLGCTDIGWDELSDALQAALCEVMGDKSFQRWLGEVAGAAAEKERKDGQA